MNSAEASQLLGISTSATPEQIEARFLELRSKFEEKIAKAPTPGLKEKYRASLNELTVAFETLTLASDASALPVLQREGVAADKPATPAVEPARATGSISENRKPVPARSNREFIIVAVLAVLLLGGGGWWVMKVRAEKAEQLRIETEARLAREAAEKERLAQLEKLGAQLRSRVAELNVAFEAQLRIEALAERELADLRSQERDVLRASDGAQTPESRAVTARLRSQQRFVEWLHDTLPSHPARFARAKAEELLDAHALDDAQPAVEAYAAAVGQLQKDLTAEKAATEVVGTVVLEANEPGAKWKLTDAFGFTFSGTAPATLNGVAVGDAQAVFTHPPHGEVTVRAKVVRSDEAKMTAEFLPASLEVVPAEAEVTIADVERRPDGRWALSPGRHEVTITHPDFAPQYLSIEVRPDQVVNVKAVLDGNYGRSAVQLARRRMLNEPMSGKQFWDRSASLAEELWEVGDTVGATEVIEAFLARQLEGISADHLPSAHFKTAMKLNRKDLASGVAAKWSELLEAGRLKPDSEFAEHMFLLTRTSSAIILGETETVDRLMGEIIQRNRVRFPNMDEKFRNGDVYLSMVYMLGPDFSDHARVWAAKARSAGLQEWKQHSLRGHLADIDVVEAIRRRDMAEALAGLRRKFDARLAVERDILGTSDQKPQVDFSDFFGEADKAQASGSRELMEGFTAFLRELDAADLLEDDSPDQYWRTRVYESVSYSAYRRAGATLLADGRRRFAEAAAIQDADESTKQLVKLASEWRNLLRNRSVDGGGAE